MLTKIIAGLVLWMMFTSLVALIAGEGENFWEDLLGFNIICLVCLGLLLILHYVIPWALKTLFG